MTSLLCVIQIVKQMTVTSLDECKNQVRRAGQCILHLCFLSVGSVVASLHMPHPVDPSRDGMSFLSFLFLNLEKNKA